jgi:hypothetical protein
MVDAAVDVMSCRLVRGRVSILVDDVVWRRCVDEDVNEDHIDVDLGDEVSAMS